MTALAEEFLDVVGVFKIAVALVGTGMGGDEVFAVINADPVGERLEQEALGGVEGGHRVAVGVQDDAAAVGGAHGAHDAGVRGHGRNRD